MSNLKKRDILYILLFLVLVLILWTGLSLLPGSASVKCSGGTQGAYSFVDQDLENTVYTITPIWDSWPQKLYSPQQLTTAKAPVPSSSINHSITQYATYRLRLTLPPGATYGISLRSSDYSMRLFIDNMEMDSMGTPGETYEKTVPQVRETVYYFTPQRGNVEIVMQAANFVHANEGGQPAALTVGTAAAISRYERNANLKTAVIFGCLMTAGLYHLAIFLMNRQQRAFLIFSALCLLLALVSADFAALLFPTYNWQLVTKVEYAIYILAANALFFLVNTLFPGVLCKWVFWGYPVAGIAYLVIILFTPAVVYTYFLTLFQALSVGVIIYGITRMAILLREKKLKSILAFSGISLFALFIIGDILNRHGIAVPSLMSGQPLSAAGGMVLFVFCNAMALSLEQAEVNQRLVEMKAAIGDAEERYQELQLQQQKNGQKPCARLADFGLTKREAEVALLLLAGKSREEITKLLGISMGTVNTHCSSIYRKAGVGSAGEFAGLMMSS